MRTPRNSAADALALLSQIALAAFVMAMLVVAREILIPIALAVLLTFLVAPLVTGLERFVGRIVAVLLVVTMLFAATGAAGWVLTQQVIDLATKLPDYKENIITKLQAFRLPTDKRFRAFFKTVEEVRKELPGAVEEVGPPGPKGGTKTATAVIMPPPAPLSTSPLAMARSILGPLVGPLGTAALVLVLVICMLFQREDLRRRLIRLVGHGHISITTRALDDATRRVSRYLLMQLVINVTIGIAVAAGLHFIGVPNAFLWGGFSTVLRFIPYVGPWIAAVLPTALALAVSPDWTMPLYTVGLFVLVELISSYAMEPWLYGSSTGISPIALILAAVVWTWLWGPLGLVLATPLTVCLVVLGRHVPEFSFLGVVLSDEEALTPAEDFYQRLLTPGESDEIELVETYLQAHSLAALYDDILLPVVIAAETDAQQDLIDHDQLVSMEQGLRDIVQDLFARVTNGDALSPGTAAVPPATPGTRVLCLAARADRDELVGSMLAHLLQQQGCEAWSVPVVSRPVAAEIIELVDKSDVDVVVISVVPPSTVLHARHLCLKLRAQFPRLAIVGGLWGAADSKGEDGSSDSEKRLRDAGATDVAFSLARAVEQVAGLSAKTPAEMTPAPIPSGEEERLAALKDLQLLDSVEDPFLDRITRRLTRIFEAPIALVSLVDREWVMFKSQVGLPEELAQARHAARDMSVCGHVVASDGVIVVEDLARDRRFAGNQWLRERGLRFYAGAPVHAPGAQPIGTLCLFDTRPRQFNQRDQRQLREYADEISEELARRAWDGAPAAAAN